jgi:hypothetical protein
MNGRYPSRWFEALAAMLLGAVFVGLAIFYPLVLLAAIAVIALAVGVTQVFVWILNREEKT